MEIKLIDFRSRIQQIPTKDQLNFGKVHKKRENNML